MLYQVQLSNDGRAIICSIEPGPGTMYYVRHVTDQHSNGDLSHLCRCPTSAEVGLYLFGSPCDI
jgi:hypothetical protein